jgi:hypothetical protein
MVEVLSVHVWIWVTETCGNDSKSRSREGERENNREDEPNEGTVCVYGNVTTKSPAKLSYTNKNILKMKWNALHKNTANSSEN